MFSSAFMIGGRRYGGGRGVAHFHQHRGHLKQTGQHTRSFSSVVSGLPATGKLAEVCLNSIEEMKTAGTFKQEKVISSMQASGIQILADGEKKKDVLNFCSNNYLGLCDNKEIIEAAKETLDTHGYGMSSVRFICGTQTLHKELEKKLAAYHGMEDCILFPSGFDANAGFFEAVFGEEDAIISDSLNHASIIDGIRLCKAKKKRYAHLDLKDLEAKLEETKDARMRVVVTDGVFSMDGDVAPLDKIRAIVDKFPDTYLFVDDCHATGFLGTTGRGTPELSNTKVDFLSTTLGKALGGATGGYIVASKEVVTILRNKARTYLFTNTIAPVVAGASIKVLEMLDQQDTLRKQLMKNTHYVRERLTDAGLVVLGHDDCPIVPVYFGDALVAQSVSSNLLERGILAIAFSYPVVPQGAARIRFQMSAAHTEEHLQKFVAAVIVAAKETGALETILKTEAFTQRADKSRIEAENAAAKEAERKDREAKEKSRREVDVGSALPASTTSTSTIGSSSGSGSLNAAAAAMPMAAPSTTNTPIRRQLSAGKPVFKTKLDLEKVARKHSAGILAVRRETQTRLASR
ncbi:unnamed protein product [Amoebophrya sp. A25]|nr:unnamed protein product [Amoebophrya sp. A25]|eukprot:GSA25T00007028001.1